MKTAKEDTITRLNSIEGHLRGIRALVEEDNHSVNVLKRTYAVQRAIEQFEQVLLRGHLSQCVPDGFREGRAEEVLNELGELFALSRC